MTRIAIYSKKALLLESMSIMLNIENTYEVNHATSKFSSLISIVEKGDIDIAILVDTLKKDCGLKEISELRRTNSKVKVLVVSDSFNNSCVRESYLIGAAGFLASTDSRIELNKAIETVLSGQQYFGKVAINALMIGEDPLPKESIQITQLTNREKEIVLLILDEKSSVEIAQLLHISQGTVETHRHNIKRKLKVRSSIGVVKYALRIGMA